MAPAADPTGSTSLQVPGTLAQRALAPAGLVAVPSHIRQAWANHAGAVTDLALRRQR